MKKLWFIWYQSLTDYSQENIEIKRFQSLIEDITFFENEDECEKDIKNLSKNDEIIFIINDQLVEKMLPRVQELPQILSIYIFCSNQKNYEEWIIEYKKIKGVFIQFKELVEKLLSEYNERQHEIIDQQSIPFTVFDGHSTNELNGAFIYSQLLINCLIRLKPKINSNEQDEFISFCKRYPRLDEVTIKNLTEVCKTYSKATPIECYTMCGGLFKVLNEALRNKEIDLLYHLRFFLRGIEQESQNKKCQSISFNKIDTVYRGQFMSSNEIKRLEASIGHFISINALFSTSLNCKLADLFCSSDSSSDGIGVQFEIKVNSTLDTIKPFVDISDISGEEQEVLFMAGSIFKLDKVVSDEKKKIWIVSLRLCFHEDEQLKSLMNHMVDESESEEMNLYLFGNILRRMGKLQDAEKYYHQFIEEKPDEDDIARCYHSLGIVADEQGDYELSLTHYQKALKISKQSFSTKKHSNIAEIYNSIGIVYRKQRAYQKALDSFGKALLKFKRICGKNNLEVAKCYHSMGNVYMVTKKYIKAHDYFQKTLAIFKNYLPPDHLNIGQCESSLGNIDSLLNKLDSALDHYDSAIEILKKSCPSQHIDMAIVLENIGIVYQKKGYWQQSLTYFHKAKSIYTNLSLHEHPTKIKIEDSIFCISSKLHMLKQNKSHY